jgi:hypothetical protein
MVTAYASEVRSLARMIGARAVVQKPFDIDDLRTAVAFWAEHGRNPSFVSRDRYDPEAVGLSSAADALSTVMERAYPRVAREASDALRGLCGALLSRIQTCRAPDDRIWPTVVRSFDDLAAKFRTLSTHCAELGRRLDRYVAGTDAPDLVEDIQGFLGRVGSAARVERRLVLEALDVDIGTVD